MKRFLLLSAVCLVLSTPATAQESIYSLTMGATLGGGLVELGAAGDQEATTRALAGVSIPVQVSWFNGSSETGGFAGFFRMALLTPLRVWTPDWHGHGVSYILRDLGLGYQFSTPLSENAYWSWGPEIVGTLNNGGYRVPSLPAATSTMSQASLSLGAATSVLYFPFDTGYGGIDGLHLDAQVSTCFSVTNLQDWQLGVHVGWGWTL